eukprot:TRINITY_DN10474_c0_g2_i1.p1 TRINITY_DN10474_c0_g2~~TRINITY_DN10474_c0_g2_i1.p1  ORF type:complete len:255 (+),score=-33.21 TRINITY_DN10474_c0_g2_i1:54-767(+)
MLIYVYIIQIQQKQLYIIYYEYRFNDYEKNVTLTSLICVNFIYYYYYYSIVIINCIFILFNLIFVQYFIYYTYKNSSNIQYMVYIRYNKNMCNLHLFLFIGVNFCVMFYIQYIMYIQYKYNQNDNIQFIVYKHYNNNNMGIRYQPRQYVLIRSDIFKRNINNIILYQQFNIFDIICSSILQPITLTNSVSPFCHYFLVVSLSPHKNLTVNQLLENCKYLTERSLRYEKFMTYLLKRM